MEDIGEARIGKLGVLFWYCLEAIWCRFRHGIKSFYYVPAPPKQAAMVRDWMVMVLCRPFYPELILHWHAAGLPAWLETHSSRLIRKVSFRLLSRAGQSISLTNYNLPDALKLSPLNAMIVPNGISDPCPDFEASVLPQRLARLAVRQQLATLGPASASTPSIEAASLVRVLFLGHCTRQKGLFDTMEGVRVAQRQLQASGSPFQLKLAVCGNFLNQAEEAEFRQLKETADFQSLVEYHGFVTGIAKDQAFRAADLFCFPTFYYAESFGLVVAEAMAYGLPVVTTRWRAIPEVLPPDYAGLVEPNQPEQIAERLVDFITHSDPRALRRHFVAHFTIEQHLTALARAIHMAGKSRAHS
jgi:glycosyltransferase involved in cell wall biosynthesis